MNRDSNIVRRTLGDPDGVRFRTAQRAVHTVRAGGSREEGVYRRRTGRLRQVTVGRHRMTVPEDMRWAFAGGRYYERSVPRPLCERINSGPSRVFYDIGANYGYYSLLLAPLANEIHAFEPVRATYAVLEENISRNAGLDHVQLHRHGLAESDGSAEINVFSSSGNNSLFDVVVGDDVSQLGTETIDLRQLDALVAGGLTPPGLIKMDVEGAELFVLRGARRTLATHLPTLLLEYHEPHFERAGYTGRDVLDELRSHGYVLTGVDDRTGQVHEMDSVHPDVGCLIAERPR